MAPRVVVLGAGYAGVSVVQQLEVELSDQDVELTWVSNHDHHFVLHEGHRLIRTPGLKDVFTVPVRQLKSEQTEFVTAEVDDIETGDNHIRFTDGSTMDYDYVVDCIGSRTAFYGIDGLEEHAVTLKSLDDALTIHDQVSTVARDATHDSPAQIVVGGAGLSGIQTAGEIAALRDAHDLPVEITLIEAMDDIFPGHSHAFQGMLEDRLDERGIEIQTGAQITEVDASSIRFKQQDSRDYDVLVWTGGITGLHEVDDPDVEVEDERIEVDRTLQSDDERLFAAGDAAIVAPDDGDSPPPTAQAAWDAAEVAAANVVRSLQGQPLKRWQYRDSGTLVSVGDAAVANDIPYVPMGTFGGPLPQLLKKLIGARWLVSADSLPRAARAWPYL